jgi:hypothetical protein
MTDTLIPTLAFVAAVFALFASARFLIRTVLVVSFMVDELTAEHPALAQPAAAPQTPLPIAA